MTKRKTCFVLLLSCFFIAISNGCRISHRPPDPGTPPPQAHEGVFVSGNDTLVFNGDGKSLSWHFEQADSLIGNNGQGQYVFLLGHMMYRYDVAETFRVIATENQNASHSFLIYKRPVTETEIVILRDDLPGHVVEQFKKIAE